MKNIKIELERRRTNNRYVREYIDSINKIKYGELEMVFINCLGELTNMPKDIEKRNKIVSLRTFYMKNE